jgi:hypothetical protein
VNHSEVQLLLDPVVSRVTTWWYLYGKATYLSTYPSACLGRSWGELMVPGDAEDAFGERKDRDAGLLLDGRSVSHRGGVLEVTSYT